MPSKIKAAEAKTVHADTTKSASTKRPVDMTAERRSVGEKAVGKASVAKAVPKPLKSVTLQAKPKADAAATKKPVAAAAPKVSARVAPEAERSPKAAAKSTVAAARKASKPAETEGKAVQGKADASVAPTRPAPVKAVSGKVSSSKAGSAKAAPSDPASGETAAAAPARTAATKSVAAALMAARRKTTPAATPTNDMKPQVSRGVDTVKGTVEVADKNVNKAVFEHETEAAPAKVAAPQPAPVAMQGGMMRRPGMPPRHNPSMAAPAKVVNKSGPKGQGFKTNEFIVYPAHGVGEIIAIEEQEVAGYKLELFVISFIKDKMILKVPLPKIASVGMRKLAEAPVVKRALDTLTGRARIKRTMWSRRAQEYEAKINSGDLVSIAEVVRDLYRSDAQPEQSYSERQLYEAALDRMAREIAVVQAITDTEALKVIDEQLRKGPRRGKAEDSETDEADEAEDVEGNIGEAA